MTAAAILTGLFVASETSAPFGKKHRVVMGATVLALVSAVTLTTTDSWGTLFTKIVKLHSPTFDFIQHNTLRAGCFKWSQIKVYLCKGLFKKYAFCGIVILKVAIVYDSAR